MTTIGIGDVLTLPKSFGFLTHMGVAIGPDRVIQNTREKGEHVATVQEFSAGKPVTVHRTGVNPSVTVARAQTVLANPQPYDPVQNNCEHTVTKIVHGIARSPQAAFYLTLTVTALVLGALWVASKRS